MHLICQKYRFCRHMLIDGPKMHKFCRCVAHEIVKVKKGAKTPDTDPDVDEVCNDLEKLLLEGGPNVKETVSTPSHDIKQLCLLLTELKCKSVNMSCKHYGNISVLMKSCKFSIVRYHFILLFLILLIVYIKSLIEPAHVIMVLIT